MLIEKNINVIFKKTNARANSRIYKPSKNKTISLLTVKKIETCHKVGDIVSVRKKNIFVSSIDIILKNYIKLSEASVEPVLAVTSRLFCIDEP